MKIAFVGKGGSGKTTLSALFALYVQDDGKPVLVFDADLNMHLPGLLGFANDFPAEKHLSHPEITRTIRSYLTGSNILEDPEDFKKTTPPTSLSNLISLKDVDQGILRDAIMKKKNINLSVIGTYEEKQIGASCYHNNLAIFENVLSHLNDRGGYVVADMVAGVDSFANSLHAQFDLICLIIEPTKRSIEVYEQYKKLATEAGTKNGLVVVANKIRDEADRVFIEKSIPSSSLIGLFEESDYLRSLDQGENSLDLNKLEDNNKKILQKIKERLKAEPDNSKKRLEKLWYLHRKYISQPHIRDQQEKLLKQIDGDFTFPSKDE